MGSNNQRRSRRERNAFDLALTSSTQAQALSSLLLIRNSYCLRSFVCLPHNGRAVRLHSPWLDRGGRGHRRRCVIYQNDCGCYEWLICDLGGTSGCVVAARLSDAHPDLSILVVERGPDNFNDPAVTNPIFFMENILNTGTANPRMMTYSGRDPEPQAGNRVMSVPAGSVLGGGSSINMLTYNRPQREELD